jgi:hypothetical protein
MPGIKPVQKYLYDISRMIIIINVVIQDDAFIMAVDIAILFKMLPSWQVENLKVPVLNI